MPINDYENMDLRLLHDLLQQMLDSSLASSLFNPLNIAVYVLTALGLYTIAKRRGIQKPWLAWIPVVNVWILGCIADQYRYVTRGEVKNRRKTLLITGILKDVMSIFVAMLSRQMLNRLLDVLLELSESAGDFDPAGLLQDIFSTAMPLMMLSLPLLVVTIINMVFYYIALYETFKSCAPDRSVLYLVLSLLFSNLVGSICLMICRHYDGGMPPRADEVQPPVFQPPVYQQPNYQQPNYQQPNYQSPAEPWERKDRE